MTSLFLRLLLSAAVAPLSDKCKISDVIMTSRSYHSYLSIRNQRPKRDFISGFSCKTRKAILFPVFYFFYFISCKFANLIFKEPTKIRRHGLPILLCCLARISVHRLRYTGLCTPHITTIHSHPMQIRAVYSGRCFPTVKLQRT